MRRRSPQQPNKHSTMIILQRFTPYLAAASALALLFFGITWPHYWLAIGFGVGVIPLLAALVMHQAHWRLEYLGLTVPMIILLLGAYSFLLIQEQWWVELMALGIAVICFFLFEKNVAVFLFQPAKYIPYSLEHISIYSTMVAAFFCYVSLAMFAGLHLARLRYLFIFVCLLTVAMVWQTFWIQKIRWSDMWRFIVVLSAVITQGMVTLYFWPVSFFVSGGLLTLILYVMLHLSRHYVMQTLTRRLVLRYSVVSLIATIFILVTARWSYV